MSYFRFSNMQVEEAVVLAFPFTDELAIAGATLTGTPTVAIANIGGAADSSASSFSVGTAQISGAKVLVPVSGRVKGADYELRVTCSTTDPYTRLTRVGRILTE